MLKAFKEINKAAKNGSLNLGKLQQEIGKIAPGLAPGLTGSKPNNAPGYGEPPKQALQPLDAPMNAIFGPYLRFLGTVASVNYYSILVINRYNQPPPLYVSTGTVQPPVLLDSYNGYFFWNFRFAIPLLPNEQQISYSINQGPAIAFWVPGSSQPYRLAFFSCNGFSDLPEAELAKFNGIQPLWNDIMRRHTTSAPFHGMIGGGDQLYCDSVFETKALHDWLLTDKKANQDAQWTADMNNECHFYYFRNYLTHFASPGFKDALACIPFNFTWDDHDIFDGYGSYPKHLQDSQIFRGLFIAAQRFYLLFQHHTNLSIAANGHEYIGKTGQSNLKLYGDSLAVFTPDVRSERNMAQIVSQDTWNQSWQAMESLPPTVRHIMINATIPLAYPRIPLEGALETSKNLMKGAFDLLNSINPEMAKTFRKQGAYSKIVNSFGESELMDDLNDHWTSENHMVERDAFIAKMQEYSAKRNVRFTLVSGDVHVCAAAQFKSSVATPIDRDPKFIMQIVSSAIGNGPPPNGVIKGMHLNSKAIPCLNGSTIESMYPIFTTDTAGAPISDQFLMNKRNWCSFTMDANQSAIVNINVEMNQGDLSGHCKSYEVVIPALKQ